MKRLLLVFAGLLLVCSARADYLEVRGGANLYAEPNSSAGILQHVDAGALLDLVSTTPQNGYYNIIVPSTGGSGWVYRTRVQGHRGDFPSVSEATGEITLDNVGITETGGASLVWAARHLALGRPVAVEDRIREGYALGHDNRLKIPLWVQYELSREDLLHDLDRSDDFRADPSLRPGARAELEDYRNSGYDRGHMAPAADMKRSAPVMSESFLLSNMAPQVGIGMNRHLWKDLEDAVRGWTLQRGRLTIITGPLFIPGPDHRVSYPVIGGDNVAVPNAFYKIVVDATTPGQVDALAFLVPNVNLSGQSYDAPQFRTSIDNIERLTGLDFLSGLPDDVEAPLEQKISDTLW